MGQIMPEVFGWGSPFGMAFWLAGVGIFFWGLSHLIKRK